MKKIFLLVIIILIGLAWFFYEGGYGAPLGLYLQKNQDGSTSYSNEQGSVSFSRNSYPKNWPLDAPKYDNGKISYGGTSEDKVSGKTATSVIFTTSDSAKKVSDFYKKELASNGWTIAQVATVNGVGVLSGQKNGTLFGVQITESSNGQTEVVVVVQI